MGSLRARSENMEAPERNPKCYISTFRLRADTFFLLRFTKKQTNLKKDFFLTQLQGQALDICNILYSSTWW